MDLIQLKLLDLMDEIDDICEKNKIGYTLSAETASMAFVLGGFASENYQMTVYMTLADFIKFQNEINNQGNHNRIIEGLHNNNKFPGFFYRYVDTSTTYYNYNYGDTYKYNGIHITIEILRCYSRNNNGKYAKLEKHFAVNSYKYKRWLKPKTKVQKFKMFLRLLGRREKQAARLEQELKDKYLVKKPFVTFYAYLNPRTFSVVKYPTYLYTRRNKIEFENKKYYVASDLEMQYKLIRGKKLENHIPSTRNYSFPMMISTNVSFQEYMKDNGERNKICRKRQGLWLTDNMHGMVTHIMNKDWEILKCVSAKLDLQGIYMPRKEALVGMYRNEQFENLIEAFEEYNEKIRYFYRKTKMTIYFDEDIFDIYLACLEYNGEFQMAKRLVRRIPEQWKNK